MFLTSVSFSCSVNLFVPGIFFLFNVTGTVWLWPFTSNLSNVIRFDLRILQFSVSYLVLKFLLNAALWLDLLVQRK